MTDQDSFLCNLCFPNANEIGMVGPMMLFENEGRYGLMGAATPHTDHEWFYFPDKPLPDLPDTPEMWNGKGDYADPAHRVYNDAWMASLDRLGDAMVMSPMSGRAFVNCCIDGGYPDEGNLAWWLLNHCGKMVARHEQPAAGEEGQ